jgi:hypothetical protein
MGKAEAKVVIRGPYYDEQGACHDDTPGAAVSFITGRDWWTNPRIRMAQ